MKELKEILKGMAKGRRRKELLAAVMLPTLYARRCDYGMGLAKPREFADLAMQFADGIVKAR